MSYPKDFLSSQSIDYAKDNIRVVFSDLTWQKVREVRENEPWKEFCDRVNLLREKVMDFIPLQEFEDVRGTIFDIENLISECVFQNAILAVYGAYFRQQFTGGNKQYPLKLDLEQNFSSLEYRAKVGNSNAAIEKLYKRYPGEASQHFRQYCTALILQMELYHICEFLTCYEFAISTLQKYHPDFMRDKTFERKLKRAMKRHVQECLETKEPIFDRPGLLL